MDRTALTEAQQQQFQLLHQQFQQQEQPAQQQQHLSSQFYYPSQAQAYDQGNQIYYPYNQYQQQPHEQHYPYYYPDYTNAYSSETQLQQPHQQQSVQESAAIYPPGISAPSESSGTLGAAVQGQAQHQSNAYYPQEIGEQHHHHRQKQQPRSQHPQQPNSSYLVPPGLNPAAATAVAALTQLSQFAGTMDAAERAMAGTQERQWHPMDGGYSPVPMPMPSRPFSMQPVVVRSPSRGGGRRGGRPFRGGGRGNYGHHHSREDGSGPSFRGRGRMGKGGRHYPPHAASSSSILAAKSDMEAAALAKGEGGSPAIAEGEVSQVQGLPVSLPASGNPAPKLRQQIAWCELCRVDCNTLEILEQHKNGKRHKKNLQRIEELQNARKNIPMIQTEQKPMSAAQNEKKHESALPSEGKPVGEVQDEQKSAQVAENEQVLVAVPESKSEIAIQPEQGTENESAADNLPTAVLSTENNMETEQPINSEEQSEITKIEPTEASARKQKMERFDTRKRGMKWKMRGGRGGKRMRMSEDLEQPKVPVKTPKKPKEVVPLICDLCNVKCDTQAVLDCHLSGKKHLSKVKRFQDHQAMYGPLGLHTLYPPNPSAQTTSFIPQGLPQDLTGYGFPQTHQAATAAGNSELQVQLSEPQVSHVTLEPGMQNVIAVEPDDQSQKGTYAVESEGQQVSSVDCKSENSASVSAEKEVSPAMNNSFAPPSMKTVEEADKVFSAIEDSGPVSEYGVTLPDHTNLPGLGINMDDHSSKNEEPIA